LTASLLPVAGKIGTCNCPESSLGHHALGAAGFGWWAIAAMYHDSIIEDPGQLPSADPASHTMGAAVDRYVRQRIPESLLDLALADRTPIEVHGIYPYHVGRVIAGARRLPTDRRIDPGKLYNSIRPRYFTAPRSGDPGRRLIIAVPPGKDYVLHYASLVAHHVRARGVSWALPHRVVRYPLAERSVADWSGLNRFVRPGDRVLLGYVQQLTELFVAAGAHVIDRSGNSYYGAVRLRFPDGGTLCTLGVRFSFWGCLAGRLAAACRELGARELIYAGKLGTLTGPADIYQRLFVPSRFVALGERPRLLGVGQTPPNPLLARYPDLASGMHMSVGTVLEESMGQRETAERYAVTTIDNEIAPIAFALAGGPRRPDIGFSAIHFATDYLRRRGERLPVGAMNLTNHRRPLARAGRLRMLREVARRLAAYYCPQLER
jgi:hypothetical protein